MCSSSSASSSDVNSDCYVVSNNCRTLCKSVRPCITISTSSESDVAKVDIVCTNTRLPPHPPMNVLNACPKPPHHPAGDIIILSSSEDNPLQNQSGSRSPPHLSEGAIFSKRVPRRVERVMITPSSESECEIPPSSNMQDGGNVGGS